MLCRACRVHVRRDFPYCLHCGTLRKGAKVTAHAAPRLRRPSVDDQGTALVARVTTIGRDPDNDVVIDDPSVSRHHARITRGEDGFVIEDLDSFNGTGVGDRTLHGDRATLTDSVLLHIGDVPLVFEQPRSAEIGSKTMVKGTEHTLLEVAAGEDTAPTATEPLAVRPRRRSGWALKHVPDDRGRERWVLRNTRSGSYLELDERDVFLWHQIDGQNSIRDLLFAYAQRYGELALPRIEQTLHGFASVDLVRGLRNQAPAVKPSLLRRFGRGLVRVLLRMEVSVKGIDTAMGRLYSAFGWRFFTRTGVFLLWVLILAGLYGFWVARAHQRLFDVGGAGVWGAVIVGVGYLAALMVHEGAHALAVKSYGRKVTRGGFMVMMAMPFAFVDTSDMWFGSRWSRLVVTLCGPLSTAAIAGGLSLGAAYVPNPMVAGICFQLAFGLYLNTLYNFNPLMPLDGYQALADALRVPRLREEAMAYATKGLWKDLAARRRPGIKQFGLAAYGLMAVVGTYLFLVLGIVAWKSRLGSLVHDHLRPPFDVLTLVGLIALLTFPVWYRYAKKLSSLPFRRRPEPDPSTVDSPAVASVGA
jgi:putative peptide zinc metalloprotease protein